MPASRPPFGREKPNGAREKLTFRPKARTTVTPSQNRQITSPATAVFVRTTESSVPCGSLTASVLEVDLVRRPAAGGVLQQPLLERDRKQADLPQLFDADPPELAQGRFRAWCYLRVASEGGLRFRLRLHACYDVDRVPVLAQKLAHVEKA
jgi:hypothetical protein